VKSDGPGCRFFSYWSLKDLLCFVIKKCGEHKNTVGHHCARAMHSIEKIEFLIKNQFKTIILQLLKIDYNEMIILIYWKISKLAGFEN